MDDLERLKKEKEAKINELRSKQKEFSFKSVIKSSQ
jgi:hypothetical protein